jgi:hypothetical protein
MILEGQEYSDSFIAELSFSVFEINFCFLLKIKYLEEKIQALS